jgi:hypothetical protein
MVMERRLFNDREVWRILKLRQFQKGLKAEDGGVIYITEIGLEITCLENMCL